MRHLSTVCEDIIAALGAHEPDSADIVDTRGGWACSSSSKANKSGIDTDEVAEHTVGIRKWHFLTD